MSKKAVLIQTPAFMFDLFKVFYHEAKKFNFFDKFYIVTDSKENSLGEDCTLIRLDKDREFGSNMISALKYVEEDIFMVCCEDHILLEKNNVDEWTKCFDKFCKTPDMGFLRLTNTKKKVLPLNGKDSISDNIFPIATKYRYYISLQPALWRKDYFRFILEDGWNSKQFEWQGAKKSRRAVRNNRSPKGLRSYSVDDTVIFRTNLSKEQSGYYRNKFVDYALKYNLPIDKSKKIKCRDGLFSFDEYVREFSKEKNEHKS
jgi:hypothetical protein